MEKVEAARESWAGACVLAPELSRGLCLGEEASLTSLPDRAGILLCASRWRLFSPVATRL